MSTANFYNHPNGIYLVPEINEKDAANWLRDNGATDTEITPEAIDNAIYEALEYDTEEFLDNLKYDYMDAGYIAGLYSKNLLVVSNANGLEIAEIRLQSGYYKGVQVIFETEPEKLENGETYYPLYQWYSPNHKKALKILASHTNQVEQAYKFNNGEAGYIFV